MAKNEFKWYRETHREEIKEAFDSFDMDSYFAAEELYKVIMESVVRIGAKQDTTIRRNKKGVEIGRTVTEEPILRADAGAKLRGLTLLAELRGWKDGNGSGDTNIVNIIASPMWVRLQQVILQATKDAPEVRKQIADALHIIEEPRRGA